MPNDMVISESRKGRNFRKPFILWPKQWKSYRSLTQLNWNVVTYKKTNLRRLPLQCGIYAFVVKPGIANLLECNYLVYIGKADDQTLRKRCPQYLHEIRKPKGRPQIKELFLNWRSRLYLYYCPIDPVACDVEKVEGELLKAFLPPCNTKFPGRWTNIVKQINS